MEVMKESPTLPASSLVPKCAGIGMKDFSQDFHRFNEARTGAIEELVSVREINVAILHRAQRFPLPLICDEGKFTERSFQTKSAWHDDNDVRVTGEKLIPICPGRVLA